MKQILINIVPFKDQPFKNPITLLEYSAKEEFNWNEIGWIIRQIRRVIRDSDHLVFQLGRKMFSTRRLSENKNLDRFSNKFEPPEEKLISCKDDEGLEILRRLIGESISHQLRNQARNAYKVVERPNAVYFASDPIEVDGFGEIDVYRGFIFVPLITKEGSAGVMIDPRNRYHTKRTLREIKFDPIMELELRHTDTCPISMCEEKLDPLSACKLSGSGNPIQIMEFRNDYPSHTTREGEEEYFNIKEYHGKESICPRGYLKDEIEDKPPVAVATFGYPYPLERIRQSPGPYLVKDPIERRKLHKLVSLDPSRRYSKTMSYMKLIQNLYIKDDIQLSSTGKLLSSLDDTTFTIQSDQFNSMQLLLGNNKKSYYANRDLGEVGPYKMPEAVEKVTSALIIIGKYKDLSYFQSKFTNMLLEPQNSDLVNIKSLSSLLNTEISIEKVLKINKPDQLQFLFSEITKLAQNNKKIIFFLAIGRESEGLVVPIRKFLIQKDLPNQGVNITVFLEKIKERQNLYFFNIILGAFCKLGGVPWAIESEDDAKLYIGYNSQFRDEKMSYSLVAYDSNGIWCGGLVSVIDKEYFENQFQSDFNKISSGHNVRKIRFYANGSLYDNSELKIIKNTLEKTNKEVSLLEIIHNPVRIYNVSNKGWFSANRGSYVKFLPNQAALVTTIPPGRQGTPQPLLVRLKEGDPSLMSNYLHEIFALTHYVGYSRMIIRYPSPVHATRQILSDVVNSNTNTSFSFKTPWFI